MKWVMKTSRIVVGRPEGDVAFRSIKDCPADVLQQLRETLPGPNACTVVITNREALEAIRSRNIEVPSRQQRKRLRQESAKQRLKVPRWQLLAVAWLAVAAVLTALLVWGMHGG